MAEFKYREERKAAAEDTMLAYKAAQDIAADDMTLLLIHKAWSCPQFLCVLL
ncbi:hypothetical protein N665_0025s0247 [Sinapis alba]|nr:hypothetical protein N665_0025s0247 [Sinapis alba]